MGRPNWRSLFLDDPDAKFPHENWHPHPTHEKLTKFREHLSQNR
jgi:hypothetical protein